MPITVVPTIRFANFLSPLLQKTYEKFVSFIGETLGYTTTFQTGNTLEEYTTGAIDIGFICGLLYVRGKDSFSYPLEPLVAPILLGQRYQDQPRYFSDVVVRHDSLYTSFEDLSGCTWAYNEQASHSGWNLVRYTLQTRQLSTSYFGTTIQSGSHLRSLHMVLDEQADATAVDSHVLDLFRQTQPEKASRLRVIDTLGPSTIPPVVVTEQMDQHLKSELRDLFISLHHHPSIAPALQAGCIKRFVPITDQNYQDIRTMLAAVQSHPGS